MQRVLGYWTVNVRRWGMMVGSWAAGDFQVRDAAWTGDVCPLP
ncbi:hypothetical protein [Streptomyces sp. NPDC059247]